MSFAQPSLKGRALRLQSGREHSRAELERKLKRYEETPGELASALDDLQAKGFISEQRVVESVLNRRASKLGAARIKQELHGKGLDPAAVADAVSSLKTTEMARAKVVWQKKFGALPEVPTQDPATRSKQMRFLAARGFEGDVIRRVVLGNGQDTFDD